MDPERNRRIKSLLEQVRALPDSEREARLASLCDDPDLVQEVLLLLDPDRTIVGDTGITEPENSVGVDVPGADQGSWRKFIEELERRSPPEPRYRLLGEVARGGMGAVLRVWDESLRRTLAMKVALGPGGADPSSAGPNTDPGSLGRFLEEAQVSSQLDHPGIVPVHELGVDETGQVYFTMKLVKGEDLRAVFRRVETNDEDWNETRVLSVILRACEAMAFAHDKGVIHRDLKPGNIMVGRFGETYVMDWGLARVLGHEDRHELRRSGEPATLVTTDRRALAGAPDSSMLTMDGSVVGTPAYMSPEQAEGRLEDMGPPSDVYAMGAILYRLLTGQMPYVKSGARIPPHTIVAMVIQGPPVPIHKLRADVPAELVAICEKAMSRDIDDRYEDMNALAHDLRAFLEDRVVLAHEAGAWPSFKKWVRRNKALAGTGALALLSTIALSGWALWERGNAKIQAVRADGNAQVAIQRAEEAEGARARADARADELAEVTDFLRGILEETDPIALSGRYFGVDTSENDRSIRDVIQAGTNQVTAGFEDKPKIRATLMHALGNVWLSFGENETADRLLKEALRLREETLPAGHPDRIASSHVLGRAEFARGNWNRSRDLFQKSLEESRRWLEGELEGRARNDAEVLLADIAFDLGVLAWQGVTPGLLREEAEPLMSESLEIRTRIFGEQSRQVCMSLMGLAMLNDGEVTAIPYLQRAVKVLDKLRGGRMFEEAAQKFVSAQLMEQLGQLDRAEAAYRECLRTGGQALGDRHVLVTVVRRQLANMLLWEKEDMPSAEAEWSKINESFIAVLGPDNVETAESHVNLMRCWRNMGDYAKAKVHGRRSVAIYVADHGSELERISTCFDVWRDVLARDAAQEFTAERVVGGVAWREAVTEMERMLEILEPRATQPNERAEKVLKLNREHLSYYEREEARLSQFATGDWQRVLDGSGDALSTCLDLRARAFADQGRFEEAIQAAEALAGLDGVTAQQRYNVACVFAKSAAALPPAAGEQREEYVLGALSSTKQALEAGWKRFDLLREGEEFSILRDREEWKALFP